MELYHKVIWERPENPLPKDGTLFKGVSMAYDAFVSVVLPNVQHMRLMHVSIDGLKVVFRSYNDVVRVEEQQLFEGESVKLVFTLENGAVIYTEKHSVVDDCFVSEHCYFNRDEDIEYHIRNVSVQVRIWDAEGTMIIQVPLDEEEE